MKKNDLFDFLIVLLVYIGLSSFPINLLVPNNVNLMIGIQILIQIIILVFILFYVKRKTSLNLENSKTFSKSLIFLPTLIVCGSNFLYFLFVKNDFSFSFELNNLLYLPLFLFVAINEELIFRLIFINNYHCNNKYKKLLISALVFGICHITVFLSTYNPFDLIVILYTFALGILLGLIYMTTNNVISTIIVHFLFNVINETLFSMCLGNSISSMWLYLLANTLIVVAVGIYLLVLILKKLIFNINN